MSEGDETKTTVTGTVEEVLPNSLFRVRLSEQADAPSEASAKEGEPDEQPLILAYLAGKMRLHRIRVLMGDQVEMVLDPYGGRARIVRRLT
ncbi:MAG: Translation initiation factor IF-1 [Parcubacteria group bacterium GW2011_GWA2_56_21]|nr:MAG: Translation initiation factor IF-1 [Parcubacteria group bacterium GW2011_GWA2_56_21]